MTQTRPNLSELPDVFAMELPQLAAISLSGEEQNHYLQGQVTCDVLSLESAKLLSGAHCNAKGKVLSVFRLFEHQSQLLLVQPTSTTPTSLKELQKFGVFAKVDINLAENINLFAIAGHGSAEIINQISDTVPDNLTPVVSTPETTIIYIAGEVPRYLFVSTQSMNDIIPEQVSSVPSDVWQLLEINDGFPVMAESHIEQYVPQMLNLQAIGAISFTKGCYLGQETVARMQYLGKNKRSLFSLSATSDSDLTSATAIEQAMGENWRKAGDVLAYYQAADGQVLLQAVLASDMESDQSLRLKEFDNVVCNIKPLPYSLT